MDKAQARKKLAELEQKIEEAEARVKNHELRVRRLAVRGLPTAGAEETLQNFKTSAQVLRDLRAQFKRRSEE